MNKKKPIENSKYVAGSMMTLLNFPRRSDAATIPYFCKHFFNVYSPLQYTARIATSFAYSGAPFTYPPTDPRETSSFRASALYYTISTFRVRKLWVVFKKVQIVAVPFLGLHRLNFHLHVVD